VLPCLLLQAPHGALIPGKSLHNRLYGTPEGQQGHDAGQGLGRLLAALEHRPCGRGKGLAAYLTAVPLLLPTMDADVTFTDLPACQTGRIRAKYGLGIQGFTLLMGWLPNRIVLMDPFLSNCVLTTVKAVLPHKGWRWLI
jgi:hypothetical protein